MYNWKQLLNSVIFLLVFALFVFFSWQGYIPQLFGFVFGLILFFKTAIWWRASLGEIFDIPRHTSRAWIFSCFLTLISCGFFVGVFIAIGFFNAITGSLGLFLSSLTALLFFNNNFVRATLVVEMEIKEERALDKILVLVYLVLFFIGLNILAYSHTNISVTTPWQIIPENYLLVYFLLTVILLRILFSKLPAKTTLVLIVFHIFLTVSYLAFSHDLFYGADIWRHLATENAFLKIGTWRNIGITDSPIIFDFGKLSYAQFLSIGIILNKVFGLNLIFINKWLQPILWAFVFPALMFSLVREMGGDKREGLLAVIFSVLPFALQVAGAFTLPVNLGFLVWLFLIWLLFKYFRERLTVQLVFLALFGFLLIFGYALYFILFWLLWFVLEVMRLVNDWSRGKKFLVSIGVFLLVATVIPVMELAIHFSHWPQIINWGQVIKQFIGNLSGWYLAFGPRPHDIATGNILFNQTPVASFVPNFLTAGGPVWIVPVAIIFWLSSFFGIVHGWRNREDFRLNALAIFSFALLFEYFIGRYFLNGEQILSRRLEVVLAFGAVFWGSHFWYGIFSSKHKFFLRFRYIFLVAVVFFSASAITASYSFGPDTRTISIDEFQAAQYIWSQVLTEEKPCVLGDTYTLLALEAISGKKIIGGGFPISANFAQPEREMLLSNLSNQTVEEVLVEAKRTTAAHRCWLVIDKTTRDVKYDRQNLQKKINNILILSF